MKSAGSFLLGVTLGALAAAVYCRMQERMEEETEMELAERMRRYMGELEARTDKLPAAKKSAAKRSASK